MTKVATRPPVLDAGVALLYLLVCGLVRAWRVLGIDDGDGSQAQLVDAQPVVRVVLPHHVLQQAPAAVDESGQRPQGVLVMVVLIDVLLQEGDAGGQHRNLDAGGAGVKLRLSPLLQGFRPQETLHFCDAGCARVQRCGELGVQALQAAT